MGIVKEMCCPRDGLESSISTSAIKVPVHGIAPRGISNDTVSAEQTAYGVIIHFNALYARDCFFVRDYQIPLCLTRLPCCSPRSVSNPSSGKSACCRSIFLLSYMIHKLSVVARAATIKHMAAEIHKPLR